MPDEPSTATQSRQGACLTQALLQTWNARARPAIDAFFVANSSEPLPASVDFSSWADLKPYMELE